MSSKNKPDSFAVLILTLFGLAICAVTVVVLYAYPITILTCREVERGRVDCQLDERMLGLIPLRKQNIVDVKDAFVVSETHEDPRRRTEIIESRVYGLVLSSSSGEISLTSHDEFGGMIVERTADQLKEYLRMPSDEPLRLWQATWVPLVVGSLFLLLSLVMLYCVVDTLVRYVFGK